MAERKKIKKMEGKKEMEEFLSFEEFFFSGYTVEQNARIFWRILKSEHFAHLLSKEALKEIKTKEKLREKYDKIVNRAKGLTITYNKIQKAEELLVQIKGWKNKKFIQGGISAPVFFISALAT